MDVETKMAGGFVTVIIGFLICIFVLSAKANGETDYCYTQMFSPDGLAPQLKLYGHRPWREDRSMGVYPTIEEAKKAANGICTFR